MKHMSFVGKANTLKLQKNPTILETFFEFLKVAGNISEYRAELWVSSFRVSSNKMTTVIVSWERNLKQQLPTNFGSEPKYIAKSLVSSLILTSAT